MLRSSMVMNFAVPGSAALLVIEVSGAVDAISHLSDKSIFCIVSSQAEPWMAKTAVFHGRISAGIGCSHKMLIYVFTELGAEGV